MSTNTVLLQSLRKHKKIRFPHTYHIWDYYSRTDNRVFLKCYHCGMIKSVNFGTSLTHEQRSEVAK